jgi:hypothetical protein
MFAFIRVLKKKGLSQLTMFYTAASFEEGRIFSLNVEMLKYFCCFHTVILEGIYE